MDVFFLLSEATTSKQTLWSRKSSLLSIDEDKNFEERDRHKSGSSTSTSTSTDEAYDTVKRAIPGVNTPIKQDKDGAPDLTPANVIVFERGGNGSKSKPDAKVETKPPPGPSATSSGKKPIPRTSSTPKISKDRPAVADNTTERTEDIEMDVRRSVSLHDYIQRQNSRSKSS